MCNDFGNRIPYDDYLRAFSQTRIPVRWPTAAPNLEPRDDIWAGLKTVPTSSRCCAGVFRRPLLTTEPGPDVAPIHDRQMVVLERSDWSAWLEQTDNEAALLRPLPEGSLEVEQVR